MDVINPTPEPTGNLIEDGQSSFDDADALGTEEQEEAPETEDYKTKFAESSREAQRLLDEKKSSDAKAEQLSTELSELRNSYKTLETKFKEDNPEGYDKVTLEREMSSLKEKVAISEEENKLSRFVGADENKAKHGEALKALGRANPAKSYDALWQENFAPFYPDKTVKRSQPETGSGAIGEEIPTGSMPKGFNTWPLEKRSAWFMKNGIEKM